MVQVLFGRVKRCWKKIFQIFICKVIDIRISQDRKRLMMVGFIQMKIGFCSQIFMVLKFSMIIVVIISMGGMCFLICMEVSIVMVVVSMQVLVLIQIVLFVNYMCDRLQMIIQMLIGLVLISRWVLDGEEVVFLVMGKILVGCI